jgi:ubiquinone/menaquinone biosynthesis C-methylase UbiE
VPVQRIPEPELMTDPEQARAYAQADFSEPHDHFVALCRERFDNQLQGEVLELGCGPGDICRRFADAFPHCHVTGVDGSQAMLDAGYDHNASHPAGDRVQLRYGLLPDAELPDHHYDAVISNSLLHHLHEPQVLWLSIIRFGKPGCPVLVMDLMRPPDRETASSMVSEYAGNEPDILKQDFFHSLLAAYTPGEIEAQLQASGLNQLKVEVVSDRHLLVSGELDN